MAVCNCFLLLLLLAAHVSFSTQSSETQKGPNTPSEVASSSSSSSSGLSVSFSLNAVRLRSPKVTLTTTSSQPEKATSSAYRARLQQTSMAMVATIPVGTPSQLQAMVLDTGSQLSWIRCHPTTNPSKNDKKNPTTIIPAAKPTLKTQSFDPSRSASFSFLPCNYPPCKQDSYYAIPTTCGHHHDCRYSLSYADGTLSEGNLVRDMFNQSLPLTLGCSSFSSDNYGGGILGMNLGRLSFASQSNSSMFSYCVPSRASSGLLVMGPNPNSYRFKYVNLITYDRPERMPNLDPLAYTLPLIGFKINGQLVNVSSTAFLANPNGSGQTFVDSATEFTYMVDEAYKAVRARIESVARFKPEYVYQGALDMCFKERDKMKIGRLIGDVRFVFKGGVEVVVEKEKNVVLAERGVYCMGIGRSDSLGIAANIIGNFHQKGLWVEYDLANRKVGFGKSPYCL